MTTPTTILVFYCSKSTPIAYIMGLIAIFSYYLMISLTDHKNVQNSLKLKKKEDPPCVLKRSGSHAEIVIVPTNERAGGAVNHPGVKNSILRHTLYCYIQ